MTEKRNTPIADALRAATVTGAHVASVAGVPYDTLSSWRQGRRVPSPDALVKLAGAIEAEAERLRKIARELREAA